MREGRGRGGREGEERGEEEKGRESERDPICYIESI